MAGHRVFASCLLACSLAVGCGDDDGGSAAGDSGPRPADATVGMDGDLPDGWTPSGDGGPVVVTDGGVVVTDDGGTTFVCYETICDGHLLECGDCVDNDGDGTTDWRDPECLGPCDNTEGPGLFSDVGGAMGNSCGVDCYFDFGNGPGNDDCLWDHRCDDLAPEADLCPYDATMVGSRSCPAEQSGQCADYCRPFTPNGCDCFGCCTFPALAGRGPGGGDGYVWIGALNADNDSTCTLDGLTDTAACPPCTPVGNCLNDCGPCEVCIGRPMPPPECYPPALPDGGLPDAATGYDAGPPPGYQCETGLQPCGLPGQPDCAPTYYCVSGCCRATDIF